MSEINAAENAIATESAPVVDAPDSSVDATESDPVETVVEDTEDSQPETTETDGSEPLGEKGQKEVITLRKRAQNAEAMIEYYKTLVAQQQNPVQPQAQQQPTQLIPPKEEDYDTWDAWSAATSKYNIEVAKTEIRQEFQQQSMRGAQIQAETKWIERLNKEAEGDPTILMAVRDETLIITPFVASLIKESEVGPKIVKYLDNNRAEAARIASLSPVFAAKEFGRIEARIAATPPPDPPKRVSQAPKPIKTVTPIGTPVVDENKMSTDDWIAMRNENQFRHRRKST